MSSVENHSKTLRVLALDFGRTHTGVAVSDPSGTIVRPLTEVREAATSAGLKAIRDAVDRVEAGLVVVGIPVSLKGGAGPQEQETREFIDALRKQLTIPVTTYDERFTSKIASFRAGSSGASPHSLAACVLLEDYLGSEQFRRQA